MDAPFVDNEVQRSQNTFTLAMIDKHKGDTNIYTFQFWGKRYCVHVEKTAVIIEELPRDR